MESFDTERSVMREVYVLLGASTPLELSRRYTEEEQVLFKNKEWDYDNPEQIQNKVKSILESVDESGLTEEEKEWRCEILWFWYHHAISVALWKDDTEKAKAFSVKASEYQGDNPNILTRTMYLLLHGKVDEAEEWLKQHESDSDYETGMEILKNYKNLGGLWPKE